MILNKCNSFVIIFLIELVTMTLKYIYAGVA